MQPGVTDAGIFIRTLLTLSQAYMERVGFWKDTYMPKIHHGVSPGLEADLRELFDFIVVGSGYAGSLVASRLARTGCYKVLLLEAGTEPEFQTTIPFLQPSNVTKYSWGLNTIPQRYAARGMKDYETKLMCGKSLGGSSLLDSGIYIPENPKDFERWARQFGLSEWNLEQAAPFFFKVASDLAPPPEGNSKDADVNEALIKAIRDGRENATKMKTERSDSIKSANPVSFLWTQAGMGMGYPINNGISSKLFDKGGFFIPNIMSQKGMRMTPASQFLGGIRDNLVVVTGVEVKRIDFNGRNKRARRVEFVDMKTNQTYEARVSREIVLSAGAVGTAQLLIQSGVGPADHLDELKIPLVQHLPVGVFLRDRVSANLFVKIRKLFTESLKSRVMNIEEVQNYMLNGTGFLASANMFGAAVLKTEALYEPDILLEMKPFGLVSPNDMVDTYNYRPEIVRAIDPHDDLFQNGGLQITITVLNPFSVGTMWLRERWNASGQYQPVVNPSYLQDDRDLVTLVKGAQFVEELVRSSYMQLLDAELVKPVFPGCPSPGNGSAVQYWRCALVHLATTGRHLTSTAPMLQVVEPNLRVRGLEGIRVIDESVFPEPVTGGFPASIMAVANKGAQFLINDNQRGCLNNQGR